jgi:AraC-like DNA-binding protein
MIYPAEADIIPFFKNLLQGLHPYAKANEVQLGFSSVVKRQALHYQPFLLSQSIMQLVCNIINLLPPKNKIEFRLLYSDDKTQLLVEIENTGINLIRVSEIASRGLYTFSSHPLQSGTIYRLSLDIQQPVATTNKQSEVNKYANDPPQFYLEFQKRFHSHFTQTEKLMASLEKSQPQEAAFMQKINALIKANLEYENFDTDAVCKAMSMSRTQLFRRMKSLIKQAPANHIKIMRLQKAKELLETTDCTVSEVSFKTGFQAISHFTKVFKKQYGILPSAYRNNNGHATNE